jgi:Cys-tRNA(Pro) deacylase
MAGTPRRRAWVSERPYAGEDVRRSHRRSSAVLPLADRFAAGGGLQPPARRRMQPETHRMAKKHTHVSETPATQHLRRAGVPFSEHTYDYVERGGTAESARQLGVDEHSVVKTLVMQDEAARPLIVLMHGDCQVSTKTLARAIGVKSIVACTPEAAERASGYMVGGTSPFATRKALPVHVEATILDLARIFINGGRRGYLLGIAPRVLVDLLGARPVECALRERERSG